MKTAERVQGHCSDVFVANFKQTSHIVLVFPQLTFTLLKLKTEPSNHQQSLFIIALKTFLAKIIKNHGFSAFTNADIPSLWGIRHYFLYNFELNLRFLS